MFPLHSTAQVPLYASYRRKTSVLFVVSLTKKESSDLRKLKTDSIHLHWIPKTHLNLKMGIKKHEH